MKKYIGYVCCFLLVTLLVGCNEPGVTTQEKYEMLQLGMTVEEVNKIMGSPGEVKSFSNQPPTETTFTWKDPNSSYYIYVTVVDGRVGSLVEYE